MSIIRIGLFSDGFTPIVDGVSMTISNYALWLNRLLGPTCVVTPFIPNYEDNEPFQVIRFLSMPTFVRPPYRIGLPEIDLRLQYLLKKQKFSIVHAHTPFSAGLLAKRVARERKAPIIATFHSSYREDLDKAIGIKPIVDDQIKRIAEFYYEVDHVWVPQKSVAATLRNYGYLGPYEVVENGIDMKPLQDKAGIRKRGSDFLGVSEGIPVGLYVGRHDAQKNLDFILRALPGIIAGLPEFRMVFVGSGSAMQDLEALAADLHISDRVMFLGTLTDRDTLRDIYCRADIFLFASAYDTWGLVVREAAACLTPSVLIRGTNAAESIVDGVNGYLAENRVDAFVARVIEALGDEAGRAAVGAAAQKTLCRSWEDVIIEVKDRYLKILEKWGD